MAVNDSYIRVLKKTVVAYVMTLFRNGVTEERNKTFSKENYKSSQNLNQVSSVPNKGANNYMLCVLRTVNRNY